MKSKQKEELKAKSINELRNLVKESEGLIFKFKLEKAQNKMKNLKSMFWERKKIALMLTVINQKLKLEKLTPKEAVKIEKVKTVKKRRTTKWKLLEEKLYL